MSRKGRARPVLAQHRHRLHKRYAALALALAIPAMASATEWAAPASESQAVNAAPHRTAQAASDTAMLAGANYTTLADGTRVHSDGDDAATSFSDEINSPGPAARAFLAAGSATDLDRAEKCLTMAIYYEAATESDDGQRAVAQVVLNRVAHPSFPNTVCGVVFQGSERTTGCQFTFTCDGSLARRPMASWWDRANRVARAALAGAVYAPVGMATHYHTLQVHPYWAGSLVHVTTIGAHTFYRWNGPAGLRSAFRVAYLGGEPAAAPHPRVYSPAPATDDDPLVLERKFEAAQPAATVQLQARTAAPAAARPTTPVPVYSEAVQARGGDTLFRGGNLPQGGGLSPELQRSGQWLDRP